MVARNSDSGLRTLSRNGCSSASFTVIRLDGPRRRLGYMNNNNNNGEEKEKEEDEEEEDDDDKGDEKSRKYVLKTSIFCSKSIAFSEA